jgi:tetratricopeptide (TPR) repeat protein
VLSPGWLSGHYNLGRVLLARGDRAAALEQMQLEQSEFWRLTGLAITHHALCQEAESTAALRGLLAMDHAGIAYQVAEIHAYRGKVDDAFEWLERAAGIHDSGLSYACVDPLLGTLHADVRWGRFLAQHGLGV